MIFRRRSRRSDEDESLETAQDADADEDVDDAGDGDEEDYDELDDEEPSVGRPRGPWDREETDADSGDASYIDLGGLIVKGAEAIDLRLQVENQQGSVAAAMLAGKDSGLELKAFAAPRSGGIWEEVRADISAEATRMGGTATEADGEFGVELILTVPVRAPDGRTGKQISRIVGVEGPRWLLRGTFLGRSAVDPDPEGVLESAFRDVIVVRGGEPMAPRDQIPMQMPAQAQAQLEGEQLEGEQPEGEQVDGEQED